MLQEGLRETLQICRYWRVFGAISIKFFSYEALRAIGWLEGQQLLYTRRNHRQYPQYAVHREREVYGDDAETFKPERWLEADEKTMREMERNFLAVSNFMSPFP